MENEFSDAVSLQKSLQMNINRDKVEREQSSRFVETDPSCGTRSHWPDMPHSRLPCEIITPTEQQIQATIDQFL